MVSEKGWRCGMDLTVALIQMDICLGEPAANRDKVVELMDKAMSKHPDVIVLPELWTTGYDLPRLKEIAEPNQGETETILSQFAKQYHVNLVAGSIAKKTEAGITNSLVVFNSVGEKISQYNKTHLFRLMDEEKYLIAGNEKGLFQIDDTPCGGVICYDIRFPEWVRVHTLAGAEILFIPAEWPIQRIDHWQTLLRARAIENQCFIVACNRVGNDLNNTFGGHSQVIGPWGEIIAEASTEEEILYATLDLAQVNKIRETIPVFEDRRQDLY